MVREKVLNTGTFLRRFCDLTFDGFSEKGILCRWQISLSMTHWCPIRKTAQLRVAAAVPCPSYVIRSCRSCFSIHMLGSPNNNHMLTGQLTRT
eukprot:1185476-Prorocentrum_minimum.AAC.3